MAVLESVRADPGEAADAAEAALVALDALERAASLVQAVEWDRLDPRVELGALRRLEGVRRRVDHGTDRAAGHLDAGGGFSVDGHKNARSCLRHLGRLSGSEVSGRIATARALRRLPAVESAYRRGEIPTAHVRAIARTVSNPRVAEFVEVADPVFAEQAATEPYREFRAWLAQWEALADADGTGADAERSHARRNASLHRSDSDGGVEMSASLGSLQGATVTEIFERFVDAEWHADWAEARSRLGDAATTADLARTAPQRRADALVEVFRRAASNHQAQSAVPLVNIVVDHTTFERELTRMTGAGEASRDRTRDGSTQLETGPDGDGPTAPGGRHDERRAALGDPALGGRRCETLGGTPLDPTDAVAAALVGHVRRVVIDAGSNVIDLGRRRRLFTGSARDAALLHGALRHHGGLACLFSGCDTTVAGLHVDHRQPASRGGPTDVANADPLCGFHNRLKEHGYRPVRTPDGTWIIHRPDGTPITPPA